MDRDISLLTAEIPHLRRYARALLRDGQAADDLVQSCLERALSRFHLWQPERRLRPWLLSIMHNLHISAVRQCSGAPVVLGYDESMSVSVAPNQEPRLEAQRALAAMWELPDEQRLAVLLVGVEEMSYREAADMLGIPIGTLMSRLHRGREALRQKLGMANPAPDLQQV